MKKVIVSIVAAAGFAATVNAVDNTRIDWQVSLNNTTWSTSVNAAPGDTVFVRSLVTYTGTESPLGLASLVFQPTVSNWDSTPPADTLLPFVNGGAGSNTSTPLGVVTNTADPTQFGRITPWGRSALSTTSFLRGHVHTGGAGGAPAGTWLRIAQAQVTSWIAGTGNTTGGSGVPIAQLSNVGRTTNDPAFNTSLLNIEVFKFGIVLGDLIPRTMIVDSPEEGFGNRNSTTGEREVYWFATLTEATGSIRGTAVVNTASIVVVPAPGAAALLGLGALVIRRRRRNC
jgi:uncharacterized protein (TIGR03382 family)